MMPRLACLAAGPMLAVFLAACSAPSQHARRGVLLEDLAWPEAEKVLTPDTVVVIPLGAAAKEHGPHLPLKNDAVIAAYFTRRVLVTADVVVLPAVNYSYYPAFVNFPGSTTLQMETARDVIVDICLSVSRHGPRRFYILNTGVSTLRALKPASERLAEAGLLMTYTDILKVDGGVVEKVRTQARGTHADEIETSMMLYMAPEIVDMRKAAKDMPEGSGGPLSRDPKDVGRYSPSGVFGDATLATREKGEKVVEAMVTGILREIESTRTGPLPVPKPEP